MKPQTTPLPITFKEEQIAEAIKAYNTLKHHYPQLWLTTASKGERKGIWLEGNPRHMQPGDFILAKFNSKVNTTNQNITLQNIPLQTNTQKPKRNVISTLLKKIIG